jgi:hypothetical protein
MADSRPNPVVCRVLGVLLLAAAGLKAQGLGVDAVGRLGILSAAEFQLAVIEYEVFLGVWLLSGRRPLGAWLLALVTFSGFAVVSFYQGWIGQTSCGCMGQLVTLSPWYALGIDLVAITALLLARPDLKLLWGKPRSVATGSLALLGCREQPLVRGSKCEELREERSIQWFGKKQWRRGSSPVWAPPCSGSASWWCRPTSSPTAAATLVRSSVKPHTLRGLPTWPPAMGSVAPLRAAATTSARQHAAPRTAAATKPARQSVRPGAVIRSCVIMAVSHLNVSRQDALTLWDAIATRGRTAMPAFARQFGINVSASSSRNAPLRVRVMGWQHVLGILL